MRRASATSNAPLNVLPDWICSAVIFIKLKSNIENHSQSKLARDPRALKTLIEVGYFTQLVVQIPLRMASHPISCQIPLRMVSHALNSTSHHYCGLNNPTARAEGHPLRRRNILIYIELSICAWRPEAGMKVANIHGVNLQHDFSRKSKHTRGASENDDPK